MWARVVVPAPRPRRKPPRLAHCRLPLPAQSRHASGVLDGVVEAFFVSLAAVAVGEFGDKTQLLAVLFAARFRRPATIMAGILCAVIANHALAGIIGRQIGHAFSPQVLRWMLGFSFIGVALWTLKPDAVNLGNLPDSRYGVFVATFISFFIAEMGDKTQIVTAMLAARYASLPAVIAGTSMGMLLADFPAVLLGHKMAQYVPLRALRYLAALIFVAIGATALTAAALG